MSRVINPFAFSSASVYRGSRDFDGTADRFSVASSSLFQVGDVDAWWSAWVNLDSVSGNRPLISKYNSDSGDYEWMVYLRSSTGGKFSLITRNAGDTAFAVADSTTAISTATWYHVFGYHDPDTNLIGIAVNGGAFNTAALSGGIRTSAVSPNIGAWQGVGAYIYTDGKLLNVAFGKPPSTPTWADLRDALYNSGNALYWENISGTDRTNWGLTSSNGVWYPLNEESAGANAVDNVNGVNMTDTGTVGVSTEVP